ncbi:MAG: NAD(P)H-dependent oxidoreductase subunit E [Spirochaetales bacterium]|nr:NAD(P)H-dependent oxidoreductase subunit E [Spirochaetales bacterium]
MTHIVSTQKVDRIIADHQHNPGSLLTILEKVQEENKQNYLPEQSLDYIARELQLSKAHVYSVITFYSFFNLKPQGKHTITVCRGTACHTRGSKKILLFISSFLGFTKNQIEQATGPLTTEDFMFTLRTVACFGQCALAPVIDIDNKIYSHITVEQLKSTIESMRRS